MLNAFECFSGQILPFALGRGEGFFFNGDKAGSHKFINGCCGKFARANGGNRNVWSGDAVAAGKNPGQSCLHGLRVGKHITPFID